MFIVIDDDSNAAIGKTLNEAFKTYENEIDTLKMDHVTWYEAIEIKVKQEISKVEVTTITKTSNKKS